MSGDARARLELYRRVVPSGLREVHVDPAAAPGGDGGSPATAFPTVAAALVGVRPGDRLLLAPGDHGYLNLFGLHGTETAWISLEALDPERPPVIRVETTDGIDVQRSDHVGLFGLRVRGREDSADADASGICVFRGSSAIRIWQCDVRGFPGGGVNCFWADAVEWEGVPLPAGGWDRVEVVFCTVADCCRRSAYNTSGISFFGAEDLVEELFDGGFGYRAIGNTISDCECTVPYSIGGIDSVTDGNGISVDSLARRNELTPPLTPYRKWGLIEGNVVVGNGGRGLHVFNSTNVLNTANVYAGNLATRSAALAGASEVEVTGTLGSAADEGVEHDENLIIPRIGRGAIAGGTRLVESASQFDPARRSARSGTGGALHPRSAGSAYRRSGPIAPFSTPFRQGDEQ